MYGTRKCNMVLFSHRLAERPSLQIDPRTREWQVRMRKNRVVWEMNEVNHGLLSLRFGSLAHITCSLRKLLQVLF